MAAHDDLVILPGTTPAPPSSAHVLGPVDPEERITVTVLLKARNPLPTDQEIEAMVLRPIADRAPVDRESYAKTYGADPSAVAGVESYARQKHLDVIAADPASRSVILSGRAADLASAFGATLSRSEVGGVSYRVVASSIRVPSSLASSIQAVLGLGDLPSARPREE